jgi:hypothetical protein
LRRLESQQHDQRVLEQVVVEGAEKLRGEKAAQSELRRSQESELTTHR